MLTYPDLRAPVWHASPNSQLGGFSSLGPRATATLGESDPGARLGHAMPHLLASSSSARIPHHTGQSMPKSNPRTIPEKSVKRSLTQG